MSTPTNKSFQTHASFAELVDCFDGFILDQFGVIRDSDYALEGAPECVTELVKSGKKLVILSNSSSLSSATVERLPKFGFDPENFVGAVTSGQEACHYIKDKFQGKKALFITWKSGNVSSAMEFMESCGNVEVTDVVEEADFILLHGAEVLRGPGVVGEAVEQSLGSFSETGEMSVIDPILQKCTTQKLPMLCCNPDFIMVKPDGTRAHMPGSFRNVRINRFILIDTHSDHYSFTGTIADRYKSMGGDVTIFGKPHVQHFEACLRDLGLPKDKVAHVGDSLHHDVVGANNSGIASIFVAGGIHRDELGSELGEVPSQEALEKLFAKHGTTPTHVVPMFKM
jgi:HAD superfamily hydrolase (TIGR01450 family)